MKSLTIFEERSEYRDFEYTISASDPNSSKFKLIIALKLKGNDSCCYYYLLNYNQDICMKILILMLPVGKLT